MRAVNIGIRHDDDPAIAQIIQPEILAGSHAKRQRQV